MDLYIYCIEIEEMVKFTSHMYHEPKAYYCRNTHILLWWYHLIYILSIDSIFHGYLSKCLFSQMKCVFVELKGQGEQI
jgi:hypothetical protein